MSGLRVGLGCVRPLDPCIFGEELSRRSKSPWLRVCLECSWEVLGKAGKEGRMRELENGLGRKSGEREKGETMTGSGPFWNRKSKEGGVFWFLVLLFCFFFFF